MSGVATAIVATGYLSSKSASKASSAQVQAAEDSTAAQERMTDKQIAAQERALNQQLAAQKEATDRQIALQEPWRQAGITGLNALVPLATNYQKFGMDQFQQDPGYAFRLSEGQKAIERSAAARSGLISGTGLKAAARYGQEMGSQEYNNAFNRYQTERASQLQPLQSLAGVGQSATNQMGSAAGAYGAGASNAYGAAGAGASNAYGALGAAESANAINAGNARASGYVGGTNAMSQGLSQYLNYNQNQNMMNMFAQNRYAPNYGQYTPGSDAFVGPMPS